VDDGGGGPIRVLVADGVDRVRVAVRELLDLQRDMTVVGLAPDGPTTVALAAALHPDLILLDARLPGADPWDLAAALHGSYPTMTLIFYTANPTAGLPEAALRAGAAGFVEKGATPQAFLRALRQAAGRAPAGADAREGDHA